MIKEVASVIRKVVEKSRNQDFIFSLHQQKLGTKACSRKNQHKSLLQLKSAHKLAFAKIVPKLVRSKFRDKFDQKSCKRIQENSREVQEQEYHPFSALTKISTKACSSKNQHINLLLQELCQNLLGQNSETSLIKEIASVLMKVVEKFRKKDFSITLLQQKIGTKACSSKNKHKMLALAKIVPILVKSEYYDNFD